MSDIRTKDPLARICALCGQPIGKHIVPAYGDPNHEAGATGLKCPPPTPEAAELPERLDG